MSQLYEQGEERQGGYRDVTPARAAENLEGVRVIDVREPHEYTGELGHIANAELLPLGTLPQRVDALDPETPLLMVCRSGGRSAQAATFLKGRGFKEVMNLAGGMLAWNAQNLPVDRTQGS